MKKIHLIIDKTKIVDYTITPLRQNQKRLKELGYNILFFRGVSDKALSCDILILISKPVLRLIGEGEPILKEVGATIKFIQKARESASKIIWLDNSDSTTVTHFELLPYVDLYLKKQLLRDKLLYTKNFVGGRIFTDFYHNKYNINDTSPFNQFFPLEEKYFEKVQLAWNIGLGDMFYSFTRKNVLRRRIPGLLPFKYYNDFYSTDTVKNTDVFIRTTANLSRELVAFHRKELLRSIENIIQKNNLTGSTKGSWLNLKQFRAQLADTKILPSPFGWGELGVRDYEAFIFGALLLKPNMTHMETWPSIFIENETYVPFNWGFEDLDSIVLQMINNKKERIRIAQNGQEAYANSISTKGMQEFCNWFIQQIEK